MKGLLILDNTCLSNLEEPHRRDRFMANLRVANWAAQPSEVNLLEAAKAQGPVRDRLFAVLRGLANGGPLLPWPFKLLQQIGQTFVAGSEFELNASGKEWYLDDPQGGCSGA